MTYRNITIDSRGLLTGASLSALGADYYAGALLPKSLPGPTVEFSPLFVPRDYDLSRPSALTIVFEPNSDQGTSVYAIKFRLLDALIAPDGTISEFVFNSLFTTPASWTKTTYWQFQNPFSGNPFWEPHELSDVRSIGFRIARRGQDSEDTYPGDIRIGLSCELDYPVKCQFLGRGAI